VSRTVLAAAALAVAVTGCATAPIALEGRDLAGRHAARPRGAARPLVVIAPVEDGRGGDGGGRLAGRAISLRAPGDWLDPELAALTSAAFEVGHPGEEEAAALVVKPRLLKAYLGSLSTSKAAVVVLEVEYAAPGKPVTTAHYRGQMIDVNWASTEGEARRSLQEAGTSCLEQLRADIEARLKS
jgi:hypothetical protein